MTIWKPRRRKPKRKVRRMGNLSFHAEMYIYVLLGLVLLINIGLAIYYTR